MAIMNSLPDQPNEFFFIYNSLFTGKQARILQGSLHYHMAGIREFDFTFQIWVIPIKVLFAAFFSKIFHTQIDCASHCNLHIWIGGCTFWQPILSCWFEHFRPCQDQSRKFQTVFQSMIILHYCRQCSLNKFPERENYLTAAKKYSI